MLAGQKEIDIDRFNKVSVNIQVKHLSFSAHADAKGIMALIQMAQAKNVMLVHGEKQKMAVLKKRIESELNVPCFDPANGETITINLKPDIPVAVSADHIQGIIAEQKKTETIVSSVPITGCIVLEDDQGKKKSNAKTLRLLSPQESLKKYNFDLGKKFGISSTKVEEPEKLLEALLEFNPYLIFPRLSLDDWKSRLLSFTADYLARKSASVSKDDPVAIVRDGTLRVGESITISLTDECAFKVCWTDASARVASDLLADLNEMDLTKVA